MKKYTVLALIAAMPAIALAKAPPFPIDKVPFTAKVTGKKAKEFVRIVLAVGAAELSPNGNNVNITAYRISCFEEAKDYPVEELIRGCNVYYLANGKDEQFIDLSISSRDNPDAPGYERNAEAERLYAAIKAVTGVELGDAGNRVVEATFLDCQARLHEENIEIASCSIGWREKF